MPYSALTGSPSSLSGAYDMSGTAGYSPVLFVFVAVVPATTNHSYSGFTRTAMYGPLGSETPMVPLGAVDAHNAGSPNGWLEAFMLVDPPAGNYDVTYSPGAAVSSIVMTIYSMLGFTQITPGSLITVSPAGTSCTLNAGSAPGKWVFGAFVCSAAITGTTGGAANGGNPRTSANLGTTGNAQNLALVDSPGSATVALSASAALSANWAGLAFSLDPMSAANADHQDTRNIVAGTLIGGAPLGGASYAQIETALANHFTNLLGTSTSVEALAQPAPNTGLVSIAVDFAEYADSATPPSVFTTSIPFGTGTGHYEIISGQLVWVPDPGTDINVEWVMCNTDTATDYQVISIIPTSSPIADQSIVIEGRVASIGTINARLILGSSTDGEFDNCEISAGGSSLNFSLKYIAGATYSFICGIQGLGPRYYQAFINGTRQLINPSGTGDEKFYLQESGTTSSLGSGNRKTAISASTALYWGATPLPISWFGMQDQYWPPGPPDTAFVATSQATSSGTYTDLATAGPAVTVIVGSSGLLEVTIYASIPVNGALSFALSGANTQAAADNYGCWGGSLFRGSATFLLKGLAPGATTVTLKYQSASGSVSFSDRRIYARPL